MCYLSNYTVELFIWPILNRSLISRCKGIESPNSVRGCTFSLIWPQEAKVRTMSCDDFANTLKNQQQTDTILLHFVIMVLRL